MSNRAVGAMILALACSLGGVPVSAQVAAPQPGQLAIDLNRVEQTGKGCLATFVIGNGFPASVDWLDMRLVLFDPQGVIADRLQVGLGPLPAGRRTLAGFYLGSQACSAIGSVLLADVPRCPGAAADGACMSVLSISNKTDLPFAP